MGERPIGITILAVLLMVYGFLNSIGALVMALWRMSRTHSSVGTENSVSNIFIIPILLIPIAILGIGLWKLKNWARILVLFGASVLVLISLISLIFGNYGEIILLGISTIILLYPLQPDVKSAFAG